MLELGFEDPSALELPTAVREETVSPDWFEDCETIAQKHQTKTLQFGVGDWINQGLALAEKHQTATLQWDIGDWFNQCPLPEEMPSTAGVPKPYDIAETVFGIPRATLYDWASTAKRIPSSVRTEKLPFTHHRAIANGLPDADDDSKKRWVDVAILEKLSVSELKERLRASKNPGTKPIPTKSFIVKLHDNLYTTLEKIARGRESTVSLVAAEFLTEHLASDEVGVIADFEAKRAEERTYERRRRAGVRTALAYNPLRLE
ncbi:MAG: hypothetical protein ACRD4X_01965 [Candidatus Acidiferrales bacterium]